MAKKQKFLQAAEEIGQKLCDTAVWHDGKCNWIGRVENQKQDAKTYYANSTQISYESLGPTVYDGTSGIAYFLSQLHECSSDETCLDTALGAIRCAVHKIESDKSLDYGFHTGSIGVIFTAVILGKKNDDRKMTSDGLRLLENILKMKKNTHGLDVISGNAGAIPPLLSLYRSFDDRRILDLAKNLGNEILSKGTKERNGLSWGPECNYAYNATHNLTGFAHGAAGMGNSLMELFRETGEEKFLHGGDKAFTYENSWFSPEIKNWPDFRSDLSPQEDRNSNNYSMGWCHGSPGICFSRLRSYEMFKKKTYLHDVKAALSGIKKQVQESIDYQWDYCLCHGLGGIADLFIYAGNVFNDKRYTSFANFIGDSGIENHAKYGALWPCGVTGGEILGLMLGIAGIGQFYLRLYDDGKIPSILLPIPE